MHIYYEGRQEMFIAGSKTNQEVGISSHSVQLSFENPFHGTP